MKWLSICCVVCIALVASAGARAEKLVKAEFASHTNDDNKDADTGVSVEVRTADQKVLLAEVSGGDAIKEYKVMSDNTLAVAVKSEASTVASCAKFVFRVGAKPNGDDTWKFRGKLTLTFDDGKTVVQEIGDTELKGKKGQLTWTDWAGGK